MVCLHVIGIQFTELQPLDMQLCNYYRFVALTLSGICIIPLLGLLYLFCASLSHVTLRYIMKCVYTRYMELVIMILVHTFLKICDFITFRSLYLGLFSKHHGQPELWAQNT